MVLKKTKKLPFPPGERTHESATLRCYNKQTNKKSPQQFPLMPAGDTFRKRSKMGPRKQVLGGVNIVYLVV